MQELESGSGLKYEAQTVEACLRLIREKRFQFPQTTDAF